MRLRTFSAAALLAAAATVPLAGAAFAQDRDCPDFATQAEAQQALAPGDPERLDRDNDGIACESNAGGAAATSTSDDAGSQVAATPVGGVEAGGGPSDVLPIALGALAAGGVGAVAARRAVVARRN